MGGGDGTGRFGGETEVSGLEETTDKTGEDSEEEKLDGEEEEGKFQLDRSQMNGYFARAQVDDREVLGGELVQISVDYNSASKDHR